MIDLDAFRSFFKRVACISLPLSTFPRQVQFDSLMEEERAERAEIKEMIDI